MWLMWGYRASCLAAIVINDQSHGIEICSGGRRGCASGLGLAGDPMTPGDNVYTVTLGEDKDTDRHNELTGLTGCGVYSSTNRQRAIGNRPGMEWAMTWSGRQLDFPCHKHSGLVDRKAAGSVVEREDKDTKFPSAEHLNKDSGRL